MNPSEVRSKSPVSSLPTSERTEEAGVNSQCHGYTGGVDSHNKHVTPHPQVFIIYWDSYFNTTPAAATSLNKFVTDLIAGPYVLGLAQYGIHLGTLVGSTVINMATYPAPTSLSEDELQSQLIKWLDDGVISVKPASHEQNVTYLILPPTTTSLTLNGTTGNFCGYHHNGKYQITTGDDNLFWAVVKEGTQGSSGQAFVDSISYCVSHELSEMFSNRDGQGYYAGNGCEIGDICESNDPNTCCNTVNYLQWNVETYWSQRDKSCIAPILNGVTIIKGHDQCLTAPEEGAEFRFQAEVSATPDWINLNDIPALSTHLSYTWSVAGATPVGPTDQQELRVQLPPGTAPITVSVSVAYNHSSKVSTQRVFTPISVQQARFEYILCKIRSEILVHLFFNPLWDPDPAFVGAVINERNIRELNGTLREMVHLGNELANLYEREVG